MNQHHKPVSTTDQFLSVPGESPASEQYPVGSEWRRWDPHVHAPGTLFEDQFRGDWEGYLTRLEQAEPQIAVLGITDYFCIQTYSITRRHKQAGRLPKVSMLFPNVELRLDIRTDRRAGLNVHLLFSPDDPDHEREIVRALGNLTCHLLDRTWRCTLADLTQLGLELDPNQRDRDAALRAGAKQFKASFTDLQQLLKTDRWVREHCLVAVAGGADGTAGLQSDDSFVQLRREIERTAQLVFSASAGDRDYWLGKKPSHDRSYIERMYGGLKPCLHGSDAHAADKVATPDRKRLCWLKGDPTFDTLRQTLLEPEERVWIGATPPPHGHSHDIISSVQMRDAPWLATSAIPLNPGLVAIVGARGSGKTALVDMISRGAGVPDTGSDSSFLRRASHPINLLGNGKVELKWLDGSSCEASLSAATSSDQPSEVCYLSQQFVERLCSSAGLARELRAEIERVIFQATEPVERHEATSFSELATILLESIRRRRRELVASVRTISEQIVAEDHLRDSLARLTKEYDDTTKKIEAVKKEIIDLLPKGKDEKVKRLAYWERVLTSIAAKIEGMKRRRQALDSLGRELSHVRNTTEPYRFREMRQQFAATDLEEHHWPAFSMVFAGDVDTIVKNAKAALDRAIDVATKGDPSSPVDPSVDPLHLSFEQVRQQRDQLKLAVDIDITQQKRYDDLQKSITDLETAARRLSTQIEHAKGAEGRKKTLMASRREAYANVFGTFVDEQATLTRLYEPLSREISNEGGALAKMQFAVQRLVDLDSWVAAGEALIDLRKTSEFRGRGSLRQVVENELLNPLREGTVEDVATAMDAFRTKYASELVKGMPNGIAPREQAKWLQDVGAWTYDYKSHSNRVRHSLRWSGCRTTLSWYTGHRTAASLSCGR